MQCSFEVHRFKKHKRPFADLHHQTRFPQARLINDRAKTLPGELQAIPVFLNQ
jgi:hypothetical protein